MPQRRPDMAERQPWLDDPSNLAPEFARARLRRGPPLDGAALGALAQARAATRAGRERVAAAWLARHARIDGAGFVTLDRAALDAAPCALAPKPCSIRRRNSSARCSTRASSGDYASERP